MSQDECIEKAEDGYYHPTNEDEIVCLVKKAIRENLQIRARGAAHSVAWSIYTNPVHGRPFNKVSQDDPPNSDDINIALDGMIKLDWIDEEKGIVEAEAGIHLGLDPDDPTGVSTLADSLLYQCFEKGWGVNDLGGITHQTISGFVTTGSAGGSLTFDLDNIIGFRVIDGNGDVSWIEKGDEIFGAMSLSVGLLGIITKVRIQLNPTFNITGQEITTPTAKDQCPIDLFGPGDDKQPSLQQYLQDTQYTRILWWPQEGTDRVVIWEASRGPDPTPPDFEPVPYEEFSENFGGQLEQLAGATFFTLLGNKGFFKTWGKLQRDFRQFKKNLIKMWQKKMPKWLAWLLATISTGVLRFILFFVVLFFSIFKPLLMKLYPTIVNIFQPLTKPGKEVKFTDYYWRSLPMDNTADDVLMGTEFTEIWIPLQYTEKSMQLLKQMFDEGGFAATNYFSTELYAGFKSSSWLSPSYTDGNDEYKDGTFRVDVFWYINNEGQPNVQGGFYEQFWNLFKDNDIPFRLHWGKFVPDYDFKFWADYYRKNLPKFEDFMKLREKRDPNNIFFTKYWKLRFTGEE
jgi:D-arabinono-1,4-lactone oxidase